MHHTELRLDFPSFFALKNPAASLRSEPRAESDTPTESRSLQYHVQAYVQMHVVLSLTAGHTSLLPPKYE